MDWQQAIEKNREALVVVIAGLIAMVRQDYLLLGGGESLFPGLRNVAGKPLEKPRDGVAISRTLHRAILRILRPAEAALRRLIVVAAAMLNCNAEENQTKTAKAAPPDFSTFAKHETVPAFPLIDPRKLLGGLARPIGVGTPRISMPGWLDTARPSRTDDQVSVTALLRRIRKLQYALGTLPKQARRLNRLISRRAKAKPGPGRVGPIRPGYPPGHKKRSRHTVDDILRNCHWLALKSGFKPP